MKLVISPTPWRTVAIGEAKYPGIDSDNGEGAEVVIFGGPDEESGIRGDTPAQAIANASAIVEAVNGTYGAGINPEAIPDILAALKEAKLALLHSGDTGGQTNYDTLEQITEAIEKAKL